LWSLLIAMASFLRGLKNKMGGKKNSSMEIVEDMNAPDFVPYINKDAVAESKKVDIKKVYLMKKKIGEGSYSSVWFAENKTSKRKVAIKMVQKAMLQSNADITALHDEVQILLEIHHPHVMKLIDFYEDAKCYHLVTELISGGELFDRICKLKKYPEDKARIISKSLLKTLDFLHTHDYVHRDLKPENILLKDEDNDVDIKIADFGFAKNKVMDLATVCGSPDYLAPEIIKLMDYEGPREERDTYSSECDIWSAGAIIYILLCGYPPFFSDSRPKLFDNIKSGKYEFHEKHWSTVSDEAKDMLKQIFELDPHQRPTAGQLLEHPWFAEMEDDEGAAAAATGAAAEDE